MDRKNVSHGKETCRWCDTCGTLLLGGSCSECGSPGREFEINSPGDIRPCMGDSVKLVLRLFRENFGTDLPLRNKSMFLNKIPGEDRTDEIIAHGSVIGVLRFDLRSGRILLEIRQAGAELFSDCAVKNVIVFGNMSGHLKGKYIPGGNIRDVSGDFPAGSPVILRKGSRIGAGVAAASSADLKNQDKAVKIRDISEPSGPVPSPDAGLQTFAGCNRGHAKRIGRAAAKEIRDFLARSEKLPLTVSFSGGKDSLAAYALACAAAGKPELIYADTGLEFPETVEYVEKFAAANRCRLHKASGGNGFWDNVGAFGPPAKDFRWCCKVCKLGPVTDLINSDFPGGTVTVEGNRRLESYSRSSIGFVTKNPFVPGQINLNPIRNWRAADVWAYIFACGLDFNPLYKKDFERIGCYLCPASLSSEWQNTRRIHPEMHARWENYLERYASENGLSPEYADLGLWRWKVLPPKMEALSEGLCLTVKKQSAGPSVELLKGASPCAAGGYSMEAIVRMRRNRDFSYVAEALKLYGDVKYSPDYEVALLKTSGGRAKLFGGGQISVTAPDADKAESVFSKALKAAVRAQMCTCCGICAKKCGRNAIKISGGMIVDAKRCVSCGKCEKSCMVMHYYDKLMVQTGGTHACGAPPSAIR